MKLKRQLQRLLNPFIWLLNKVDFFIIQCYFVLFHKKEITEWYAKFIMKSVDGWRIASELQYYYFLIADMYQLQSILKIKKTKILPGLFGKKKLYIIYPSFNRKSAKNWLKYVNEYYTWITQKAEFEKPGRNEICCEKGKKAKDCNCLRGWNLPNPEQATINKYQPFIKRPAALNNPFF